MTGDGDVTDSRGRWLEDSASGWLTGDGDDGQMATLAGGADSGSVGNI